MDKKYIVYFDSGTTNSRAYLLDEEFNVLNRKKKNVGSKDSSIAGSNKILLDGLYELYTELLKDSGLKDENVKSIYMSGMVTSPYGVHEVPHLILPLSIEEFSGRLYRHYEDVNFKRNVYLVPGLKTVNEDFSFVGNMRGEEIEIIGTLNELRHKGVDDVALIMPGSHTHVTYVKDNGIRDIISNFSGELFHALKEETILAPILSEDFQELDAEMVKKAIENLGKFGFNRALYIGHAMRMMNVATPLQQFSYTEGVINGGIREALEYYCQHRWTECQSVALVCNEFMYKLFSIIFEGSKYIKNIIWLPISDEKSYAVDGLKEIVKHRGEGTDE